MPKEMKELPQEAMSERDERIRMLQARYAREDPEMVPAVTPRKARRTPEDVDNSVWVFDMSVKHDRRKLVRLDVLAEASGLDFDAASHRVRRGNSIDGRYWQYRGKRHGRVRPVYDSKGETWVNGAVAAVAMNVWHNAIQTALIRCGSCAGRYWSLESVEDAKLCEATADFRKPTASPTRGPPDKKGHVQVCYVFSSCGARWDSSVQAARSLRVSPSMIRERIKRRTVFGGIVLSRESFEEDLARRVENIGGSNACQPTAQAAIQ